MEELKFVKRGVYKKVNKRNSFNSPAKRRIQGLQERIDQLREIKSADKFHHDEDLRPRLRKSMLVREIQNQEKNIISSTPHHTKDPNSQQFFGKNISIILSPISLGRLSNQNNQLITNNENKNGNQKDALREDLSEGIDLNNIKNLSPACIGTEKDKDQQEPKETLQKSQSDQSQNRSKIEKEFNKTPNQDSKKFESNKSFNSHENSRVKGTPKSPEKCLPKSPPKVLSAQQTAVKRSRIPLRTASQEREKALELNNNSQANKNHTLEKSHDGKDLAPEKKAHKKPVNREKENVKNVTGGRKVVPLKLPDTVIEQDGKDPDNLNASNKYNDQNGNESIVNISSTDSLTHFKENDNADLVQNCGNISVKHNNQSAGSADHSNVELDHNRTDFVNKTPRRPNNKTLPSLETQELLCNKKVEIPVILFSEASLCEKVDFGNKSRTSAVRCEPPDKCNGISGVFSKSPVLPTIGLNKSQQTEIFQTTRLDKSVGIQAALEGSINSDGDASSEIKSAKRIDDSELNLRNNAVIKKKTIDREIQTSIAVQETNKEEGIDTNPLATLIAEISARKSLPSQENQVSINKNLGQRRRSGQIKKFISLEKNNSEVPVEESIIKEASGYSHPNSVRGCPCPDSTSSSGRGSDIVEAGYDYGESNSRQIFLSLEEENILDVFNLSETGEEEPFVPHNESRSNKNFRYTVENELPEHLPALTLQNAGCYSRSICNSGDSRNSLRSCNALARNIPKGLHRDVTLIKTTTRQYKKSLKITEEANDQQRKTISSPTFNNSVMSKVATICNNENLCLETSVSTRGQKTPKAQGDQQSKVADSKITSKEVLSGTRKRQYNKKSLKISKKPVQQPIDTDSSLTPDQTLVSKATVMSDNDNLSSSYTENRRQQANTERDHLQTESGISKGLVEQTFISKASKRSKKGDKNVSLANISKASMRSNKDSRDISLASFSNTVNNAISLSSADQQLLGVRPLSDLTTSNKATCNIEAEHGTADNNVQAENLEKNGQGKQLIQESQNIDKQRVENAVETMVAENNVVRSSPLRVRRGRKKNNLVESRSSLSIISQCNILLTVDGSRSQRNRKPVRHLTDIIIDEEFLRDLANKSKVKKTKENKTQVNQTKVNKTKVNTTKVNKTKVREDEPIRKKRGRPRKVPNEVSNLPQSSKDDSAKNAENPPSHQEPDDWMENENMPPPKKSCIITSTKKSSKRNLNDDSGADTLSNINNTNNKTLRTRSNKESKISTKKSEQSADDVRIANDDHGENPTSHQKPDDRTENEIMPPPDARSRITSTSKNPTERNLNDDSGVNTLSNINNTNNKTLGTRSYKKSNKSPKKSKQSADDVSIANNDHGDNPPSHQKPDDRTENENMPPPKESSRITSPFKKPTKRNLTDDSGFKTLSSNINNTNNKNSRTRPYKKSKKSTKESEQSLDDVRIANDVHERGHEDHSENTSVLNSVSTSQQSYEKRSPEKNDAHDDLQRLSDTSRDHRPSISSFAQNIDGNGSFIPSTESEYINFVRHGELYSLRYANEVPSDSDYTSFGSIEVTQTVKYPNDLVSCGFMRLRAGRCKRPNFTTRYLFVYNVMKGSVLVTCDNQKKTMKEREFFVIPEGMEYSLQNLNPQSELVLQYTKVKSVQD